ncbi:MAG: hypothetical protein U0175_20415 [Caldilineaceae bacterium]
MAKQRFALEVNGPKRLEISWGMFWRNITIRLDDQIIGTVPSRKELSQGYDIFLPDTSLLNIKFARTFITQELQVLRNGQPLPGSASDPQSRVNAAANVIFFIAGLNIVVGLIALFFQVDFLLAYGLGIESIITGLIYAILGFFVKRKSLAALVIAIILFVLDGAFGLVTAVEVGANPGSMVIARIVLLIPMLQGFSAIRNLKKPVRPSRPALMYKQG